MTLEYLETNFYQVKGKAVHLSGEAKTLATSFGDEEAEHVAALTGAIKKSGGKPVKSPHVRVPGDQPGQLPEARLHAGERRRRRLQRRRPVATNKTLLAAAGSIVQVEARHAASIAVLTGSKITPNGAFDKPLTMKQVLAAAGPLIKS